MSHLQGHREGGRWSQAGLSMCGDLELRNRLRGAWECEVWAVGVREGNGLGSLSWAPACRWRRLTLSLTQRSYPRLWRKGDQAKLRESIARVVAWVVQVRLRPELGAESPEGKGGVRRTPDPKFSLGSQDILLFFCWSSAPRTRLVLVDAWYPILG